MSVPESSLTPWQTAVAWIMREHEDGWLDEAPARELEAWLKADPAHREAYREATRLWLALGFIPAADERR